MACPTISSITDCQELCKFEARNNLRLALYKGVGPSPTQIEVIYDGTDPLPCASTFDFGDCKCGATGYGLYTSAEQTTTQCDGGNIWVLSGLYYYYNDCSFEQKAELNVAHSRTEKINIGNPNLNFWSCRECKCRTELTEEVRCTVNTVDDLSLNPTCGQRCMVRNGGNPIEYSAMDMGGGVCAWRRVNNTFASAAAPGSLGAVGLSCPSPTPLSPIVYNVGCPAIDTLAAGNRCGNNYTYPFALIPTLGSRIQTTTLNDASPINPASSGSTIISSIPLVLTETRELIIWVNIVGSYTLQDLPEELSNITFTVELLDALLIPQGSVTIQSNGDVVSSPTLTRYRNDGSFFTSSTVVAGNYTLQVTANTVETSANTWHQLIASEIKYLVIMNPSC